jgi:hypothetical protein
MQEPEKRDASRAEQEEEEFEVSVLFVLKFMDQNF